MKLTITFILLFLLVSCSSKQELQPEWSLTVTEEGTLETIKDKLYLTDQSGRFEIDIQTGKKTKATEQTAKHDFITVRKTGKESKIKKWNLVNSENAYSLIETFSSIDNCQLSLHKYWLERTDENNRKIVYTLGKSERYYVSDFKSIENNLFIIKNPALGGDAYHLEKYELE
jgi:hypothetical protein